MFAWLTLCHHGKQLPNLIFPSFISHSLSGCQQAPRLRTWGRSLLSPRPGRHKRSVVSVSLSSSVRLLFQAVFFIVPPSFPEIAWPCFVTASGPFEPRRPAPGSLSWSLSTWGLGALHYCSLRLLTARVLLILELFYDTAVPNRTQNATGWRALIVLAKCPPGRKRLFATMFNSGSERRSPPGLLARNMHNQMDLFNFTLCSCQWI